MQFIPWILLVVLAFFYFGGMRLSQFKRLNLTYYIVFLLMDDSIREDHKKKFQNWITKSSAKNAAQLTLAASITIERMADLFFEEGDSLLGAQAYLWNSDEAKNLRKSVT